jgi:hypothetical protein
MLWTMLVAPIMAAQQGLAISQLPTYLCDGAKLLFGQACAHASAFEAWVPAAYLLWNVAFNIVAILGIRSVGAASMTLAMTAAVPIAIWLFTLTWPLLGAPPHLGSRFAAGATTLLAGLTLYNAPQLLHLQSDATGVFGEKAADVRVT